MAGALKELCEEASCSVCLDFFRDPVTIAGCGHTFCRACLTHSWGESAGAEASCPLCRGPAQEGTLRPNQQLANIAEIAKKFTLQQGTEAVVANTKGRVCQQHQEPLKLFCKEDEALICVVCDRTKKHRNHNTIPLEEASQEYKDLFCSCLEGLKKERERIVTCKADIEKESQDLLKQSTGDKQEMITKFRELRSLLEEQEKRLLTEMEEMEKEVARKRDQDLAELSEALSSLDSLTQEMAEKCQQPASDLLQDVRSILQRYEEKKKFENPVTSTFALKGQICDLSNLNPLLERFIKQVRDALDSGLHLHELETPFHHAIEPLRQFIIPDQTEEGGSQGRQCSLQDNRRPPGHFEADPGTSTSAPGMHPLRTQLDIGQDSNPCSLYIPVPVTKFNLFNWKEKAPSYSSDPLEMCQFVKSIFSTCLPNYADIQQLLGFFFTAEERSLVHRAAQVAAQAEADALREGTNPPTVADLYPSTDRGWDPNNETERNRLAAYRRIILAGIKNGIPRRHDLSKLYSLVQKSDEAPSAFLERIRMECRKWTSLDPDDATNRALLNSIFIGGSAPDIRKKLDKIEGNTLKNPGKLLQMATTVFQKRTKVAADRKDAAREKAIKASLLQIHEDLQKIQRGQPQRPVFGPNMLTSHAPLSRDQCAFCKELGHWKSECPWLWGQFWDPPF